MSKFYAWLLLIVSTVQWIGGHICYEVAYLVEVEQVMSEPEQAISNEIFEETGVAAGVNILPEGQHLRTGADYGNYFAFSKSDSTGTVFYTIDFAPRTVTWEQVAGHLPQKEQDDAPNTSILKLLFSEFLFLHNELPNDETDALATVNFDLDSFIDRMAASPNSPPPDFI